MMLHGKLRRARLREPPMVPMINVVFLLLLYFMLAGSLNEKRLAVVPPLSDSDLRLTPKSIILTATESGELRLQDSPVDLDGLSAALVSHNAGDSPAPVLQFVADQNAPSRVLHEVLAAAQAASFAEIEILTRLDP